MSDESFEDPMEDEQPDTLEDEQPDTLEDEDPDTLEDEDPDTLEDENEQPEDEQHKVQSNQLKKGGGDETKIHDDRTVIVKNPEDLVKSVAEKKTSECSIHNPNGQADVCSPPTLVQAMAKFVDAKGTLKKGAVDNQSSRTKFRDAVNKVITSRKIVNAAKELLNCDSESCVLQSSEFRQFAQQAGFQESLDAIIREFFKPAGPAKNFGLLNNLHIDNVLTQLEKKFPTFLHIPFQMRDFEKYKTALATVDLADEFAKGKRTFGVVLNTDFTVGPGIHWFCLFGEYKPEQKKVIIEYFNSSGEPPLPEVQAWIHKTENLLKFKMKVDVDIKYSTGIRLQSDNHSCGVYCLMYIWLRLEGKDFKWFNTSNVGDKLMHNARQALFIAG